MKTPRLNLPAFATKLAIALVLLVPLAPNLVAAPLGTAFTYQGKLSNNGIVASGIYDFRFILFDADLGGSQVGPILTNATVTVSGGLFTVALDFGAGVFEANSRWLEIGVRTNGSGTFATLSPRQTVHPTPYALYAPSAGAATSATIATTAGTATIANGVTAGQVVKSLNTLRDDVSIAGGANITVNPSAQVLTLASPTDWHVGGNAGTTPGSQFLGTTDNQALELKVNGQRGLRLEPTLAPNFIAGSPDNTIASGANGSTIAGGGTPASPIGGSNYVGGSFSSIGGGYANVVSGGTGFIGGGWGNSIVGGVSSTVIGGGAANSVQSAGSVIAGGSGGTILVGAHSAVIGGGIDNQILTNAYYSTIAGGSFNTIQTNAFDSTISGGGANLVGSNAYEAVIAGGYQNTIQDRAMGSVIGGGTYNVVQTNAQYAVISGGASNTNGATHAVVVGGFRNAALGRSSLAAGTQAKANHAGTFVWADYQNIDFASTAANQFLIRATNGVGINKTNPATALDVNGTITAANFAGSGAGLTGISTTSLADNAVTAAKLANDAASLAKVTAGTMTTSGGSVGIGTASPFDALLDVEGDLRLNTHDLFLREGNDRNHGLGWYGTGKLFAGVNIDGPVLYGWSGGGLGATSSTNLALRWTGDGNVAVDPLGQNNGTLVPGLTFGMSSGEGISSKRTAGGNQYGLDFYTSFQNRLAITQSGNVGIGTTTPQSRLHVNGSATVDGHLYLPATTSSAGAIYSSGSTLIHAYGDGNFFAGREAGNLTMSGYYNVGLGFQALSANTSGDFNTASGEGALHSNTSGNANTAHGAAALYYNTGGSANTAHGASALYSNKTGEGNTAQGYTALYRNTNGWYNTGVGTGALYSNAGGSDNTAIGGNALYSATGNNNIALGSAAGLNLTTGDNNIAIGNRGVATDTNVIRIGVVGTQQNTFIAGIWGRLASGGISVYVNSAGQLGTATSSRRFKTDIQDMGEASAGLLALRPVTFRYRPKLDPEGQLQFGLIAEEVEEVNPDLVVHDDQGQPYTVRYDAVNAMLLHEFLKEHRKVQDLEERLQRLEALVLHQLEGSR